METLGDVALQLAAARQQQEGFAGHLRQFAGRLAEPPAALPEPVALLLDEIMRLITDQARLEDRLAFSLRELDGLRRQLDRAEREARLDALTGIPNRAHFDRELRAAVARSRRDAEPLCLLMIDIDHFKAFNDRHGHQMGDQVLRLVARQLGTHAAGGGAPARYGGEEFALILRQCDLARAGVIAAQLRKGVSGKKILNRRTGESLGQVTLSIGAALYRPGESAADLVHRADEALYLAKARGRDQVVADDHPGLSG
jgi:diguanylate cyclase